MLSNKLKGIFGRLFLNPQKNIIIGHKKLRRLVEKICKKEKIICGTSANFNFNDLGKIWLHPNWTNLFMVTINDIKNGIGYRKDKSNKKGNCVLQFLNCNGKDMFLAVYFLKTNNNYTIYMIKLEKPEDVSDSHLHSLKH